MEGSTALCRSGYFPDWVSEGGFVKTLGYIAGVDETWRTKVWVLVVLDASSAPRQLTTLSDFFKGMRWDKMTFFFLPTLPSTFFPPSPFM